MYAVRRTLVIVGSAGLLLLGGPAYAGNHDTSTSSDTPTVDIGPDMPAPEAPTVDCNFIAPDAGQGETVPGDSGPSDPVTDPAPDGSVKPDPAPDAEPVPAPQDGQPVGDMFCIAASGPGIPEADTVTDTSAGGGAGAGAGGSGSLPPAGQLPRTGPAPLLPTLAVGGWLFLLGVVAMVLGRRRTPFSQF